MEPQSSTSLKNTVNLRTIKGQWCYHFVAHTDKKVYPDEDYQPLTPPVIKRIFGVEENDFQIQLRIGRNVTIVGFGEVYMFAYISIMSGCCREITLGTGSYAESTIVDEFTMPCKPLSL